MLHDHYLENHPHFRVIVKFMDTGISLVFALKNNVVILLILSDLRRETITFL